MNLLAAWQAAVSGLLATAARTQAGAVEQAARHVCRALGAGRRVFTFGTGHGHLLALEIFYRAGGLAQVAPMLEEDLMLHRSASRSSQLERDPARAAGLLDRYGPAAGDLLVIASSSGRNAVPVELALRAAERDVVVIALTGVAGSRARPSRHPSGRVLAEAAAVVLDTGAPDGDASLAVPGVTERMGPVSTIVGAFLLHAAVMRAAEL
ncbi:MAG TPA: sugar isomerase domain-containing protein, partial [Verrucomicrobiota bacterium]|nr:sugar isomerase domain-containing protein [Verrucomicrobiota bacterium]